MTFRWHMGAIIGCYKLPSRHGLNGPKFVLGSMTFRWHMGTRIDCCKLPLRSMTFRWHMATRIGCCKLPSRHGLLCNPRIPCRVLLCRGGPIDMQLTHTAWPRFFSPSYYCMFQHFAARRSSAASICGWCHPFDQ